MKLHFHREENQSNEQTHHRNVPSHNDNENEEGDHGRNEPLERMEIIPANDAQRPWELLTRNQRKNRKKKLNRYKYEVIRHVYYRFTSRDIKKILIHMNIRKENLNRVGNTIFLSLHNEKIRKRVEEKLDDEIFTKEHYYRLYRR
jgi:hypothetical protein